VGGLHQRQVAKSYHNQIIINNIMPSGTSDFFGLNHYTTELAEYGVFTGETSYDKDQDLFKTQDPAWPSSAANWLKVIKKL
jgi:hypothetical protein